MKHARTGTNRKRKRKVDYEEESDEEEAVPFACKKCGKWRQAKRNDALLITMIIQDTLIILSGFCCATTVRMGGTHLVSGHR